MTTPAAESTQSVTRHVRCLHCSRPIPAASFAYTSAAKQRVLASCVGCKRQVTLPTATWLRWSK